MELEVFALVFEEEVVVVEAAAVGGGGVRTKGDEATAPPPAPPPALPSLVTRSFCGEAMPGSPISLTLTSLAHRSLIALLNSSQTVMLGMERDSASASTSRCSSLRPLKERVATCCRWEEG